MTSTLANGLGAGRFRFPSRQVECVQPNPEAAARELDGMQTGLRGAPSQQMSRFEFPAGNGAYKSRGSRR